MLPEVLSPRLQFPQAPSQLSDRRIDGAPPDLWLPEEGSASGLQWSVVPDAARRDAGGAAERRWATQAEPAAITQQYAGAVPEDGCLERVLEAVYHAGAAPGSTAEHFSTAGPADQAEVVLCEGMAATHLDSPQRQRAPGKISVPAPEPITLPPWGSRAAANPPPRQPQQGMSKPGVPGLVTSPAGVTGLNIGSRCQHLSITMPKPNFLTSGAMQMMTCGTLALIR